MRANMMAEPVTPAGQCQVSMLLGGGRSPCQTPGMADFRVFASGSSKSYSGEAARYQVSEGGVLTVFDGEGTRLQFSPSGWLSVEDQPELDVPEIEFPP